MKELEKYISPLIEEMFPSFYRDEGKTFVAFAKAYYEYLEDTNNTLYYSRRLPDIRDIDKTLDEFIVYFKEKYLKNIQFTTASNKRLFVKHALEFHRSKGTERSVDLFFRLIFGLPADVYRPGKDIFTTSDNEWIEEEYLEVSRKDINASLVNKVVTGSISGATAFVDRFVRKKSLVSYVDMLIISNRSGNFQTGETLISDGTLEGMPRLVGSLSNFEYLASLGFFVGDTVKFTSNNGTGAKAIVSSIENTTGAVSFTLEDGGFGYNTTSDVLVSERVLVCNNYNMTNTLVSTPFVQFDTVQMNLANVQIENADGLFTNNEVVYAYDGGGNVIFQGTVMSVTQDTDISNNGYVQINYDTGSVPLANSDTLYNTGNVIAANIGTYSDISATGNVIAFGSNATIVYDANTATANIIVSDVIYQNTGLVDTANATVANSRTISGVLYIDVTDINGAFDTNKLFNLRRNEVNTGNSYNIIEFTNASFGVINVENNFAIGGNVYSLETGTHATLNSLSTGTGADFAITQIDHEYTFGYNSDFIRDYANVDLANSDFGFPAVGIEDIDSPSIANALTYTTTTIGTIAEITITNPGTDYSLAPYVIVYEEAAAIFNKYDYFMTFNDEDGVFAEGELISGEGIDANSIPQGIITNIVNTTAMFVKRTTLFEDFNTGQIITGESTGTTANLQVVNLQYNLPISGLNADISANTQTANGRITSLRLVDSGIGYTNSEIVTVSSLSNTAATGTVKLILEKQGIKEGFFQNRKGFLSNDKYLYDGEYYQEYSYEVQAAVPFDKYSDMLKKVLHVAGTKVFGKYVSSVEASSEITVAESEISVA